VFFSQLIAQNEIVDVLPSSPKFSLFQVKTVDSIFFNQVGEDIN